MTQLVVTGLTSGYGEHPAIEDVSLTADRGEVVAVLGANGAGKTTLLSTVQGLNKAWRGSVELASQDVTGWTCERRVRQGMVLVPEGHQVVNPLTVIENLQLGAVRFGGRARRETDEREAFVYDLFPRLAERRKQVSASLSGGEQQMVAIGRALMARPDVVLFDEPSLGLAPAVIDSIYASLSGLKQLGLAIVLVEQNVGSALAIADHAMLLRLGRVVTSGRPDELSQAGMEAAYLGAGD